jgi:hypothetical protein
LIHRRLIASVIPVKLWQHFPQMAIQNSH